MNTDEIGPIEQYIQQQRIIHTPEAITQQLLDAGYTAPAIAAGWQAVNGVAGAPSPPRAPISRPSSARRVSGPDVIWFLVGLISFPIVYLLCSQLLVAFVEAALRSDPALEGSTNTLILGVFAGLPLVGLVVGLILLVSPRTRALGAGLVVSVPITWCAMAVIGLMMMT